MLSVADASVSMTSQLYGASASVTCDVGFTFDPNDHLANTLEATCDENAEWITDVTTSLRHLTTVPASCSRKQGLFVYNLVDIFST